MTYPDSKAQSCILLLFAHLVVLLAYGSTLQPLFARWTTWDGSQSHGLVIVALSVYLYCQRVETGMLLKRPDVLALICIIPVSLLWALSAAVSINIVEEFCLLLLLLLMQISLFGLQYARPLLGPVALLIFAVPVWDYLTPALVSLSSLVVTTALQPVDITAYIDGNSIFLPFGTIVIADGCSGLRYLLIALALSVYLILTSRIRPALALIVLMISAGLGLLVNWLRIYIIILVAYRTQMQSGLIEDHENIGWVLFILVILPIFFMAGRLSLYQHRKLDWPFDGRSRKVLILTVLAMLSGPLLLLMQSQALSRPDNIELPAAEALESAGFTEMYDKILPEPDIAVSLEFRRAGAKIKLLSGFYWQKQTGDSLVPYMPNPVNTTEWRIVAIEKKMLDDGTQLLIMTLEHKLISAKRLHAYWYRVGSFKTIDYKTAKLLQYPAVLTGYNLFQHTRLDTGCSALDCEEEKETIIDAAQRFNKLLKMKN